MPPFKRMHRYDVEFIHPETGGLAQQEAGIPLEGKVYAMQLRVANFANASNAVLTITDVDGYTIYTSPTCNKNTNTDLMATNVYLPLPVTSGFSCHLTVDAAAGAGANTANESHLIMFVDGLKSGA
jgi:hypothetical protein